MWSPGYRIVVPEFLQQQLGRTEIRHILEHETSHIRHGDDECGLFLRILVALTWITPLSHYLFYRWSNSIEMRCDLDAANDPSADARKDYANTLLRVLRLTAGRGRRYPVASFLTHHLRNEKMRIKSLLRRDTTALNGNNGGSDGEPNDEPGSLFVLSTIAGCCFHNSDGNDRQCSGRNRGVPCIIWG